MAAVSVIVPCYNYGRYLPDAIHSLTGGETCRGRSPGQTLRDFEAIVVDDGSTDQTNEIARELAAQDPRVRLLKKENGGTASALNLGIRHATAEYLYILSADDLIEPWTLEAMLAYGLQNPHSVCYGDLKTITGGQIKKDWPLTGYSFQKVVEKNPIPAAGVLYPKACWEEVGGYPEVMRWGREGWAFNIACGLSGWCGHHIGGYCGYLYRWDGQNRSGRTGGKSLQSPGVTWKDFYQKQIEGLFPQLFQRSEPMSSCCGEPVTKSRGNNTPPQVAKVIPTLPGKGGFAVVEYRGPSTLDQTYWVGATPYSFGKKKVGYVAKDHLAKIIGMRGKQGEVLFVEVVPPPPPPAPKAVTPPAPVEEIEAKEEEPAPEMEAQDLDAEKEPDPLPAKPAQPEATGAAQRLAEEHGIKLSQITPTGAQGQVVKADVQDYIEQMEEAGRAPWLEGEGEE